MQVGEASYGMGVVFSLRLEQPRWQGLVFVQPSVHLAAATLHCWLLYIFLSLSHSLSVSSLFRWKASISEGCERLPHIFTLHKVFHFNALTSASHFSCVQMQSTAHCTDVYFNALCCAVTQIKLYLQICACTTSHTTEALRQQYPFVYALCF